MIENVTTQLTVFHCFAHCLLPGRAFASLYALLFLEKEAEIGGRVSTRGNASTTASRAEQYSDSCDSDQDCDHVQVLPVQKEVTAPSVPRLRIPTYLTVRTR